LNNEIGSFYEGPLPSNTIIRNNTFTNTFFDSITVYTNGRGAVARNIAITDNRITGWHTNPRKPEVGSGDPSAQCQRGGDQGQHHRTERRDGEHLAAPSDWKTARTLKTAATSTD
jgi:hypothetical protein